MARASGLQQASLTLLYKIHSYMEIAYKSGYLFEAGGSQRTRSNPLQYHRSNVYTDGAENSFFTRNITTWNRLTPEAVSSETLEGF